MKAAVFYGKNDLRVEERDIPEIGKNDVLVRVHACGICGTDVHIFCGDEGAAPTPENTVLGHEFAGEVVKVGTGVKSVTAGDKVCVDPNKLIESGKLDVSSMIYKTEPLEELPSILADGKRRGAGKYIITM